MVAVQPAVPTLKGRRFAGIFGLLRADRLELLQRVARECGDIGILQAGPSKFVLLNTPELAHQVLVAQSEHFEKGSPLRRFGRPVFGKGLVTSLNAFHRRQRRLVAPAFQHRRIAAYAATMADYTEQLQRSWRDGATIDVAHEMMRLTLWIVGKTLFDTDLLDDAAALGEAVTISQR
jgi:cytochrome P450